MAKIFGTNQSDTLTGTTLDDDIFGWPEGGDGNTDIGNDILTGLAGNDKIWGGGGNDTFNGGAGADILTGGAGTDLGVYSDSSAGVFVNLVAGTGKFGDAEGDLLGSIEDLIGSDHSDTLIGDNADNVLLGGAGADSLFAGGGFDRLIGGLGFDTISLNGGGTDSVQFNALAESGDQIFNFIAGFGGDTLRFTSDDFEGANFNIGDQTTWDVVVQANTVTTFIGNADLVIWNVDNSIDTWAEVDAALNSQSGAFDRGVFFITDDGNRSYLWFDNDVNTDTGGAGVTLVGTFNGVGDATSFVLSEFLIV